MINIYQPQKSFLFGFLPLFNCDEYMVKYFGDSQAFWAEFTDYGVNYLKGGKATSILMVYFTQGTLMKKVGLS